jgi:hypothetical protein
MTMLSAHDLHCHEGTHGALAARQRALLVTVQPDKSWQRLLEGGRFIASLRALRRDDQSVQDG